MPTLSEKAEISQKESAARKLLENFFDDGSFSEMNRFGNETSTVVTGVGFVGGETVCAFAQDRDARSGAVDKVAAGKLEKIYSLALKNGTPVVAFYDSLGGDISEGAELLKSYGGMLRSSSGLSGVAPQIAVVTGTCSGLSAVLALSADFVIVTEKAELFLNDASGETDNSGVAAVKVKDETEAVTAAKKLLMLLPRNNLETASFDFYQENALDINASLKGGDLVKAIAGENSLVEIFAGFGQAFTGFGSLNYKTVAFVAAGDVISAKDTEKIAKFVTIADSFSIPVVTLLDASGFKKGGNCDCKSAVLRGAARLTAVYTAATTAKITVITGNAIGAAYGVFVAGSDITIAYENAVISPISPKAAAVLLETDEQAYKDTSASAFTAADSGLIDSIIEAVNVREAVASAVDLLSDKRVSSPARKHIN